MLIRSNSKGQIVIPASLRRRLDIKEGTRIYIEVDEHAHRIVLIPITRAYIHSLRGKYRGAGVLQALMAERLHERDK